MLHGVEAHGLPPARLRTLWLMFGRQCGLQSRGNLDCLFRLLAPTHEDPRFTVILRQFCAIHRLVSHWPIDLRLMLDQAWEVSWRELTHKQHPWKVTKGPLQVMQTILMKDGWEAPTLRSWTFARSDNTWYVKIDEPVHEGVDALSAVHEILQWERISSLPGGDGAANGGDLNVMRKLVSSNELTNLEKVGLKALLQGTVRHAGNGGPKTC